MNDEFRLFPEQGSSAAAQVDALYFFLVGVGAFFTILIFLLIVSFAIYFRRGAGRGAKPQSLHGKWVLEFAWSAIPLALTMVMFGWGAWLYFQGHRAPDDAIVIDVVGKQWMWKVYHPDGRREINELHIPVGQPVRLRMISEDVIHSFYIPAFRVKQDVLPDRYTSLWFTATRPGEHYLFCAEYCGADHADMSGRVVAMPPSAYAAWLADAEGASQPASEGQALYMRAQCHQCHDRGDRERCPSLEGLFGQPVRLATGEEVIADESYLRESIVEPAAKVVAGYRSDMPTYRNQLSEEEILQIVAFLKSRPGREEASPQ